MGIRKEKVEYYRKQLIARRKSLEDEIRTTTAQLLQEETAFTDVVDQAVAETDRSFILQMKNRDRDVLWQIQEALKRLDEGSFGDCERCDDVISEGRIEAFPFATLCIDCKVELESKEHRYPQKH